MPSCLTSIKRQNYPKYLINIIIADGGSSDLTLKIAKTYNCKIVSNPLKTGEAGKAIALKQVKKDFVALIDSDDILPTKIWLKQMIRPLIKDKDLIGSEPWKFTYRPNSGFIERYSSLIGANDPYAWFSGIYDRYSYLSRRWTDQILNQTNYKKYIKVTLTKNSIIPTIGANGTVFKTSFLKNNLTNPNFLFDIDILQSAISKSNHPVYFAKVKNSIIHSFCEASINKFIKKQTRRINDFYYYRQFRKYNWNSTDNKFAILFSIYSLSLILPFKDSIKGYFRKPDLAWFFHPLACLLTTYLYSSRYLINLLGLK